MILLKKLYLYKELKKESKKYKNLLVYAYILTILNALGTSIIFSTEAIYNHIFA